MLTITPFELLFIVLGIVILFPLIRGAVVLIFAFTLAFLVVLGDLMITIYKYIALKLFNL